MCISLDNTQLKLTLRIKVNNTHYCMHFDNVSRLCIENISAPMEIQSLAVVDNSASGWERVATYWIHDFEDDILSFFCESYDCIPVSDV